jgi:NAD(P)-dependent dehydrogenase (short-subunit alcohol dehydrogenase family)
MDLHLAGKSALVSGSTAGIGFAIAKGLAREGATVYVNGRTEERVQQAIRAITAENPDAKLHGVAADLGTAEGAEILFRELPAVDILINNLGIFEPRQFEDITDDEWRRFFDINVLSGIRLSRHYAPTMRKQGWGRIMFISSESGVQIPVEMIHYGVTKTAQLAVARGLAESLAGTGVTVNSILPGPTRSEGVEQFIKDMATHDSKSEEDVERDFFKSARPSSLIQRFATTEEVASLVVYVASELSSATTGAALRVDGGVVRSIV